MLISDEYCTTVSNPFFSFLDAPSLAYPPNSSCPPYSPHVSLTRAAHRAALTASADVGPLMTAVIINCPEEHANPMNNNNNNHHHLARVVGGIAAVLANSSFGHSMYVVKRRSVPPRLAEDSNNHHHQRHHSQLSYRLFFPPSLCSPSHENCPHIICLHFLDQSPTC